MMKTMGGPSGRGHLGKRIGINGRTNLTGMHLAPVETSQRLSDLESQLTVLGPRLDLRPKQ